MPHFDPSSRPRLELGFFGAASTPDLHLSVDGMTPSGPNLSHWPGNRTPAKWKQDLSTSICMSYARAPAEEQLEFLSGAEVVLNDHYDTDGFGSLLAVLEAREVVLHHGHSHVRSWQRRQDAGRPHLFGGGSSTEPGGEGYWVLDVEDHRTVEALHLLPGREHAPR
jgi:hypothetical protein